MVAIALQLSDNFRKEIEIMSERETDNQFEAVRVPDEIISSIRTRLTSELDKTLEGVMQRAPEVRAAFEAQWAEGTREATYYLDWGDPLNNNLHLLATTLKQWMEIDQGDNMVNVSVRGRGRPGDLTDELVATNNHLARQARIQAGAVDISESALQTALEYIRESKEKAIDYQEWGSAATWRDHEKNVKLALGGLGLEQLSE